MDACEGDPQQQTLSNLREALRPSRFHIQGIHMYIRKKIRDLKAHLKPLAPNEGFYIAFAGLEDRLADIAKVGFSVPPVAGERLLPAGKFGIASRRNADGEEIIHKDKPLETHYRQREWTWKEFRGRYDYEEKYKIVEVPYKRYPRSWKPPHGVELQVRAAPNDTLAITAGPFYLSNVDQELLLNAVHMFVELFGECRLVKEDLAEATPVPVRRLNWEVLPPGKYPWSRAEPAVERVIQPTSAGDQAVLRERVKTITAYEPDFIAIGRNGFSRYMVYGWDEHQLYVLESTEVNNATYVLKNNWEAVSAMTKAEVLDSGMHHARLVHRNSWWNGVADLMRTEGIPRSTPGRKTT